MPKVRTFFLCGFLCWTVTTAAQHIQLTDSLRGVFQAQPRITAKFHNRMSFIGGNAAGFRGIKAGLSFQDKLEFGLGFHWLRRNRVVLSNAEEPFDQAQIRFSYIAIYAEYRYAWKPHWRFTFPMQFGFGNTRADFESSTAIGAASIRKFRWHYEPAMHMEYVFLNYFRFGFGIGYRLMLNRDNSTMPSFTAPTVAILFGFNAGQWWGEFQRNRGSR